MIVVSDTSPINYLVLLGLQEILPSLFREVLIPTGVLAELRSDRTPPLVKAWADQLPAWVVVRSPTTVSPPTGVDKGEAEALALAKEIGADTVLIDDDKGRRLALRMGLHARGTLGVLDAAARLGLIELIPVLDRLERTNFRAPAGVLAEMRARSRGSAPE